LLPKRIAVISVDTSKGYADFRKIIDHNDWGYGFFHMLFPALLQGENAVASILGQLERVRIVKSHFDAVAIIRGGGGDIGLTCYNNYELVKAVAMFPLPVITGIGHSTNETVTEMVSFKNAITPTDLADFLIQKFHNFSVPLKNAQDIILNRFNRLILDEKSRIMTTVRHFKTETFSRLAQNRYEIKQEVSSLHRQAVFYVKQHRAQHILQNLMRIETGSTNIFRTQKRAIDHSQRTAIPIVAGLIRDRMKEISGIEKNIELLNPMNILNRGYSITLVNGKAVKTIKQVDGIIGSTANTVNKNETHD
jgi:exodeoxyribonuclease VII large subunit